MSKYKKYHNILDLGIPSLTPAQTQFFNYFCKLFKTFSNIYFCYFLDIINICIYVNIFNLQHLKWDSIKR